MTFSIFIVRIEPVFQTLKTDLRKVFYNLNVYLNQIAYAVQHDNRCGIRLDRAAHWGDRIQTMNLRVKNSSTSKFSFLPTIDTLEK